MTLAFLIQSSQQAPLLGPLTMAAIFGIFYFLVFMPMQRQKKAQQKMLSELKNGDTVVTSGGIVGSIVSVSDDGTLVLRVKPGDVKLQVTRASVASIWNPEKASQ